MRVVFLENLQLLIRKTIRTYKKVENYIEYTN